MTKRIWELDALRGACILGMVLLHLLYDLSLFFGLRIPEPLLFLQSWGGIAFLLLSGLSVTLGSRHISRGLMVFSCGLLCTAVTAGMYALGFAEKDMIIYFGILHCLGCCMLLWALFGRFPTWGIAGFGLLLTILGIFVDGIMVDFPWLMPLGIVYPGFATSDYFPLLPNLGIFLLGAVIGKTLYARKTTLFPLANSNGTTTRFLCLCGRHALIIYLLHQPILTAILRIVDTLIIRSAAV